MPLPWWTHLDPGFCEAGRSGGFATSRGTTPCSFLARWLIRDRWAHEYRVCGTHRNAALRDRPAGAWTEWPLPSHGPPPGR